MITPPQMPTNGRYAKRSETTVRNGMTRLAAGASAIANQMIPNVTLGARRRSAPASAIATPITTRAGHSPAAPVPFESRYSSVS